jgi:hypothetical protein
MQIDIRETEEEINEIVFADEGSHAHTLTKSHYTSIRDNCDYVNLCNKEHALNLIKAIEKAIELDWFE